MNRVFVVQHVHSVNGGQEDVKLLGFYSSRDEATAAVARFRQLPGFNDVPSMANPSLPGPTEGFYVDEFELNRDCWSEGYVST